MMTDEEVKKIYASAPVERENIEIISISASWFSKTYYLQRQVTDDLQIKLETGETVIANYVPMSIDQASNNDDLTYERNIVFEMVNDIIASENDSYDPEIHGKELPMFTSRGYILYRNGDVSNIKGAPIKLPLRRMRRDTVGTIANVSTKPGNEAATGEIATVTRVPFLRGF